MQTNGNKWLVRARSIAEFVRRAIREALPATSDAPWMKYAGFVETGDSQSSQSIDEIVYGRKD